MVLHASADLRIATFGGNEEVRRALGAQAKMEVEREGGRVEGGPQIGGGRRQRQAQRAVRGDGARWHRFDSCGGGLRRNYSSRL